MRRSFTSARPKKVFADDTKMWLVFVSICLTAVIGADQYLVYQTGRMTDQRERAEVKIRADRNETAAAEEELAKIKRGVEQIQNVGAANVLLRDSIQNLFDIVPDPITLSRIEMNETTLTLQGTTPTREVFNYMLYPPLKSIFKTTRTSFSVHGGGYVFTSVNQKETNATSDGGEE